MLNHRGDRWALMTLMTEIELYNNRDEKKICTQVYNLAKHMIAHAFQQFSTSTPQLHDDKQLYELLPVTDRVTTLMREASERSEVQLQIIKQV